MKFRYALMILAAIVIIAACGDNAPRQEAPPPQITAADEQAIKAVEAAQPQVADDGGPKRFGLTEQQRRAVFLAALEAQKRAADEKHKELYQAALAKKNGLTEVQLSHIISEGVSKSWANPEGASAAANQGEPAGRGSRLSEKEARKFLNGLKRNVMKASWERGIIVVNPAEWARLTYEDKQFLLVMTGEAILRLYGQEIVEFRCGYTNKRLGFYFHNCDPEIY